jgi:hypothetical protein
MAKSYGRKRRSLSPEKACINRDFLVKTRGLEFSILMGWRISGQFSSLREAVDGPRGDVFPLGDGGKELHGPSPWFAEAAAFDTLTWI